MTMNWPFAAVRLSDDGEAADASARLELVELREAVKDLVVMKDYVATCEDKRILDFTHVPEGYTEAMAREFVNEPNTVRWAMLADGRFVGTIEVRMVSEQGRAIDVGYMTSPWGRGKGYATRALKLVLAYCFEQGAHRFEGKAAVQNRASRHVMEQAGMQFEGVMRAGEYLCGQFNDLAVYARLATD